MIGFASETIVVLLHEWLGASGWKNRSMEEILCRLKTVLQTVLYFQSYFKHFHIYFETVKWKDSVGKKYQVFPRYHSKLSIFYLIFFGSKIISFFVIKFTSFLIDALFILEKRLKFSILVA